MSILVRDTLTDIKIETLSVDGPQKRSVLKILLAFMRRIKAMVRTPSQSQ